MHVFNRPVDKQSYAVSWFLIFYINIVLIYFTGCRTGDFRNVKHIVAVCAYFNIYIVSVKFVPSFVFS